MVQKIKVKSNPSLSWAWPSSAPACFSYFCGWPSVTLLVQYYLTTVFAPDPLAPFSTPITAPYIQTSLLKLKGSVPYGLTVIPLQCQHPKLIIKIWVERGNNNGQRLCLVLQWNRIEIYSFWSPRYMTLPLTYHSKNQSWKKCWGVPAVYGDLPVPEFLRPLPGGHWSS